MLNIIALLVIVHQFPDANTFPYPGAFKPDEEVTFQEIKCVPGGKNRLQGLQGLKAYVSVQKPGTDEFFRYHTDPIRSDNLLHVQVPGGQLKVQWSFERQQPIIIELLQDGETPVGTLETSLADIVQAAYDKRGLNMNDGVAVCFFKTYHHDSQKYLKMEWTGHDLASAAAYFEIVHLAQGRDEELIYRSEISFAPRGSLKFTWSPAFIEKDIFEGIGMIHIDVYDAENENQCSFIGRYTFQNKKHINTGAVEILDDNHRRMGTMKLDGLREIKIASLLKYIEEGLELKFSVAIDFTESNYYTYDRNGNTVYPRLHEFDADGRNQYTVSLEAVGRVISQYDKDKKFPAMGFGAQGLPYLFYLNNGNDVTRSTPAEGEIYQIAGIMEAYTVRVNELYPQRLGGPTVFVDIIKTIAKIADEEADEGAYQVLLIITDGDINKVQETKNAIISASDKAMSIIIVGVGDSQFKTMKKLDGDDGSLVKHAPGARDIVQFVPMKKYLNRGNELNNALERKLAQEVLEELPDQIMTYLKAHKKNKSVSKSVSKALRFFSIGSSSKSKSK